MLFTSNIHPKGIYFVLLCLLPLWTLGQLNSTIIEVTDEFTLGDAWIWEGKEMNIPFQIPINASQSTILLENKFDIMELECSPDTLFILFEGVAWFADLELNGRFLAFQEDPFSPWLIPVPIKWLKEKGNHLRLTLRLGEVHPFYPEPFMGIFRPVHLLDRMTLSRFQYSHLPKVIHSDTICIYAPYYNKNGFIFSEFNALRDLWHAKKMGHTTLYFPYEPSQKLLKLCSDLGFREIENLPENAWVFWLNEYPFERMVESHPSKFWLDLHNNRTEDYGEFERLDGGNKHVSANLPFEIPNFILFSGILIWLLALLLIKVFLPLFFKSFSRVLLNPKLFLESYTDLSLNNSGQLYLLLFIKILFLALTLSASISYLVNNSEWYVYDFLNEGGVLRGLFQSEGSSVSLFAKTMFVVGLWIMLKYFVLVLIGKVYRVHELVEGMIKVEVLSSYPLAFLLPIPIMLILFLGNTWESFFLLIEGLLLVIYVGRLLYVNYLGLEKRFKFSKTINLLYICASIFLPILLLI